METRNLYTDEVIINKEKNCIIKSTCIKFSEDTWISFHQDKAGEKIGPFIILTKNPNGDKTNIIDLGITNAKLLNKNPYQFEYNEKWTVDAKSIFAIILPENYVFSKLDITEEQGAIIKPHREAHDNINILYYIIFAEDFRSYILSLNGVIEYDEKAFNEIINGKNRI